MIKFKLSKSKDQQTITVRYDDTTDISGATSVLAEVYTDDLSEAYNTYTFTAGELTAFKAGVVEISTLLLLGTATPPDDFYTVYLTLSGGTLSDPAGVGITLAATAETYLKQGIVDVYSPDFRLDKVLMTAHMILSEMNSIEDMDSSLQKRIDFTTRHDMLRKILNY